MDGAPPSPNKKIPATSCHNGTERRMGRQRVVNASRKEAHKSSNGCTAAKETTMKRFLKSMFAVLKKTTEPKSAEAAKRPGPTPPLEVRSQVKAGSFSWGATNP
jgi:hypothetical protein